MEVDSSPISNNSGEGGVIKSPVSSSFGQNLEKYDVNVNQNHGASADQNTELMNSIPSNNEVCFCCLGNDQSYMTLKSCKHAYLLEKIIEYRLPEQENRIICNYCHTILKKICAFKIQVEDSYKYFSTKFVIPVKKALDMRLSKTVVLDTYTNMETEIKIKPEIINIKMEDFRIDVADDSNCSDTEIDVPLSQIKEDLQDKPNSRQIYFNKKYDGKLKSVTLSEVELQEERLKELSNPTFAKKQFKCMTCIVGYDHQQHLNDHNNKKHSGNGGQLECNICKSNLSTVGSYKNHLHRHYKRYECTTCGKRSMSVYSLLDHYRTQHGNNETKYKCHKCDYTTDWYRQYRYHLEKHKGKAKCDLCDSTFVSNSGLKTHKFTIHRQSPRMYNCDECDKVYHGRSSLTAHMKSHHNTQDVAAYCVTCRIHFRTEANLQRHLKTNLVHCKETDKNFVCDECGQKFRTEKLLSQHIDWKHLKISKHSCGLCDMKFSTKDHLKRHTLFIHEKKQLPRNKMCDYCGKGFTSNSVLRTHIRTHTGERPLKCTQCSASFAHPAALYMHNKMVHKNKGGSSNADQVNVSIAPTD